MVTSGWGVWALSPCGLVLVICLSMCLSEEPHIKPADCSRKEHPVVSYQGEQRNTPPIEWGGRPTNEVRAQKWRHACKIRNFVHFNHFSLGPPHRSNLCAHAKLNKGPNLAPKFMLKGDTFLAEVRDCVACTFTHCEKRTVYLFPTRQFLFSNNIIYVVFLCKNTHSQIYEKVGELKRVTHTKAVFLWAHFQSDDFHM